MRGKQLRRLQQSHRRWIIPAHAGQTCTRSWAERNRSDHPRACGANTQSVVFDALVCGSSPRMRGKRRARGRPRHHTRIIPAHAGQTYQTRPGQRHPQDHPRACGANAALDVAWVDPAGSSPRMRGKLGGSACPCRSDRIIPAHAGQTSLTPLPCLRAPDHPRACGANAADTAPTMLPTGSSPRMRGKHKDFVKISTTVRIIPAHAGQTRRSRFNGVFNSDHPRACGANLTAYIIHGPDVGSSPRMRGKPRVLR